MIETIDRAPELLSLALKYVAAALLLSVAVLISLDVTMRFFFNQPIIGVAEIVSNGVVVIAFLQLGYAVRVRGMLRSELLLSRLGRRGKIVLEAFTCLLGMLLFSLIAAASWGPLWRAIEVREFIGHAAFQMPTWPLRMAIVFCSILAVVNYGFLALRAVVLGQTGDEGPLPTLRTGGR